MSVTPRIGKTPPVADASALSVLPPLHFIFIKEVMLGITLAVETKTTEAVAEQPFLSDTVTVYVAALRPVAFKFDPPEGDHEYVYGVIPPVAVTVALPLLLPQVGLT